MYGTVAKMRVKPERFDEVMELFAEWNRDLMPKIDGAIGGLTYRLDSDPNMLVVCAAFESKKKYFANAENPEQDKWYQRMRECLESDPEWNDGEIVDASGTFG